jgi:hypothetical protein
MIGSVLYSSRVLAHAMKLLTTHYVYDEENWNNWQDVNNRF